MADEKRQCKTCAHWLRAAGGSENGLCCEWVDDIITRHQHHDGCSEWASRKEYPNAI